MSKWWHDIKEALELPSAPWWWLKESEKAEDSVFMERLLARILLDACIIICLIRVGKCTGRALWQGVQNMWSHIKQSTKNKTPGT